jgi:intracellular sulfur oxidation DsrE/DsrF family protein
MALTRRTAFTRLAAAASASLVAWRANAAVPSTAGSVPNVVYHLADLDKVGFALGNIGNHIKGMGGPDKVHIVLVVHGPALSAFKTGQANADLRGRLKVLTGQGVDLGACGNTLDAQKLDVSQLLPGFVRIDEGGVVRLAELQAQGYAYIRP